MRTTLALITSMVVAGCAGSDGGGDPIDATPPGPRCEDLATYEADEVTCDGLDNDCDGEADNVRSPPAWHRDVDADGFGNRAWVMTGCAAPDGFVADSNDCDDADALVHPGAPELCDGLDNDCAAATAEACGNGCTPRQRGDGRRYLFCTTQLALAPAQAACDAEAMRLVRVDDLIENDWIRATAAGGSTPRLGGTDVATEGHWIWEDGANFWEGAAAGAAQNGLFTRWAPGEPNDASANEDCAQLRTDGQWNDLGCETALPFVCERY